MAVTQQELHEQLQRRSFLRMRSPLDWLYALLLFAGAVFAYHKYSYLMGFYEVVILFAVAVGLVVFGWYWKSIRVLLAVVAVVSLWSVMLYGPEIAALKAQGLGVAGASA